MRTSSKRTKGIPFAKGLTLPADVVTETIGIFGRKGSGKTHTAGVVAEGLIDLGAQELILDPIGNWYGLRLGPDGIAKSIHIGRRAGDETADYVEGFMRLAADA